MNESLIIGDLTFAIHRSNRRRNIGITVDRDGALILHAPANCSSSTLQSVVLGKSLWIYTKLVEKEKLFRSSSPKQYISGEGFYYLGRSYRLLLIKPEDERVRALRLSQGRFMLRRDEQHRAEQHFVSWYIQHGQLWLSNKVDLFASRIGVVPKKVSVRDLGFRWGSCSPAGRINFHYRIMHLPPRIIEYLVVHELIHLFKPNHDQEFWGRIRMVLPDYTARRKWLVENGSIFK
jgi:predicted metal-dependent hydrolase